MGFSTGKLLLVLCSGLLTLHAQSTADWRYGGNVSGTRYSPLKQINRQNVGKLREAWRYDVTGGRGPGLQTQPVVIGGVVYGNTPAGAVVAIAGGTRKNIWCCDSQAAGPPPGGDTDWAHGPDTRIFAGVRRHVYELPA